jgi:RNA polymerase sigma-70 factor (ECF subfamily)
VVAARAGERWASEALFRRYAAMVNGLALRLMGRDSDVDDLVQESFASALASLHRLDAPQAFSSWLAAIVVRTASKILRRRRLLVRLGIRRNEPIDLDTLIAKSAPPDAAAELRGLYARLDALPANLRVPLVLRRVEGMALDEIAQAVGVSLATVKRRLTLAEAQLALSGAAGGSA